MTNNEVKTKLDELQQTFMEGKFWNHDPSKANDPESVRDIPCTHHGEACKNHDGKCGCNFFGKGLQCHGFALYMASRVFGTYPGVLTSGGDFGDEDRKNGWEIYFGSDCTKLTLEPGDIIRADGHSAIVHYIDGDDVYVGEVWGNPPKAEKNCMIAWGGFNRDKDRKKAVDILKNARFVVKAPKTPEKISVTVAFNANANGEISNPGSQQYEFGKNIPIFLL